MNSSRVRPVLIVLLTVTSIVALLGPVARVRGQPGLPIVGVWSDTYSSSNVTDGSLIIGSTVTFEVNVTDAPSFNGYELSLYYDPNFLSAQSTDFATGTVFNNPFAGKNDLSAPGAVSVAVVNLGSSFDGGSGTLMHIRFLVKKIGVSPLSLAQGTAEPGTGAQSWTRLVLGFSTIDVSTSDGYFKNDPSGVGPNASFNYTNVNEPTGISQSVIFDASSSVDPENPTGVGHGISQYIWDFGDGNTVGTLFPVTFHTYDQGIGFGNYSVRLTVIDQNDAFEGMAGHLDTVRQSPFQPFLISTTIGSPGLPPIEFTAGSGSTTSVSLENFATFPVNVTVNGYVSPAITGGPTLSFSPNPTSVSPGQSGNSFMTISTRPSTPAGNYGIIITGTDGNVTSTTIVLLTVLQSSSFPEISVRNFFGNLGGHPLLRDSLGNPIVNAVIAHGTLRSTNPGQIVAWTNLTNIGTLPLGSLRIEDQLPIDWSVGQSNDHSQNTVRIFLEQPNGTQMELTHNFTLRVEGLRQQTVFLEITNTTLTLQGKAFDPGQSLLLSVRLDYQLVGTHQTPSNFPIAYRASALGLAWTMPGLAGTTVSANGVGIFIVVAKVWGDVNGDLKVDIQDLALVAYSFGSVPGALQWNAAANLDGSGQIDIGDLAIVAINYGDSY